MGILVRSWQYLLDLSKCLNSPERVVRNLWHIPQQSCSMLKQHCFLVIPPIKIQLMTLWGTIANHQLHHVSIICSPVYIIHIICYIYIFVIYIYKLYAPCRTCQNNLRSISVSSFGRRWNSIPIFAAFVLGLGSTVLGQFFVKRFRLGQPLGQSLPDRAFVCPTKWYLGLSENRVYSQWNSHLIGIIIINPINHWV